MDRSLEKEVATHSSILVWRTPRTEKPGGLQSMGSQRVGQTEWLKNKKMERQRYRVIGRLSDVKMLVLIMAMFPRDVSGKTVSILSTWAFLSKLGCEFVRLRRTNLRDRLLENPESPLLFDSEPLLMSQFCAQPLPSEGVLPWVTPPSLRQIVRRRPLRRSCDKDIKI